MLKSNLDPLMVMYTSCRLGSFVNFFFKKTFWKDSSFNKMIFVLVKFKLKS